MICALLLAAGESRRMGAQKALLPFGKTTVIAHIADQILQSAVQSTIVVTGHEGDRVAAALSGRTVSIVANPDYKDGMLCSVRCGLRALPKSCRAVVVVLGDQPGITSHLLDVIVSAFESNDSRIVVPVHGGRRGHPLMFSAACVEEILAHFDDVGLRGLLHAHPDEVLELNVEDAMILSDMDFPEDYQRELARLESRRNSDPAGRVPRAT